VWRNAHGRLALHVPRAQPQPIPIRPVAIASQTDGTRRCCETLPQSEASIGSIYLTPTRRRSPILTPAVDARLQTRGHSGTARSTPHVSAVGRTYIPVVVSPDRRRQPVKGIMSWRPATTGKNDLGRWPYPMPMALYRAVGIDPTSDQLCRWRDIFGDLCRR
jgi:hypothetical protein